MSDNNDDTLLEGDIGDDVDYDLGNEDEDALLADDYDVQGSSHRTVYLGGQDVLGSQDRYHREPEEPFDDVLDLGVTEGDDLDSELQESQEPDKLRHKKDPKLLHRLEQQKQGELTGTAHIPQEARYVEGQEMAVTQNVAGVESEEEEEDAEESRGDRFKTERTSIVSLKAPNKSYGNIPDSLDNVRVEDAKHMVRRDVAWRGPRRGRGAFLGRGAGGAPRPQFTGNFNVHPLQQQQQGFIGPRFGVDGFVRPPGRPGARGGIYSRPQLSQQQQPPHKILINPHFRGAVQPHPEARLIWDTEMPANQPQPQPLPSFQPLEPAYQITPQGGGYTAQQFQPPPPQHDPHPLAPPLHYDSPSQQGGYYPAEQPYTQEQPTVPHWQDNCDPRQQGGSDMYTQPSAVPLGMESGVHHEAVFHSMGEPSMNHGQPVYGTGMEQYETVLPQQQQQQQGVFHEMLPPQQHYHSLPPPVMASVWHCAADGSTDDGLQLIPATHPVPSQYHSQGMYRLPVHSSVLGPTKFRQPSPVPYRHPVGHGYVNQGGRPSVLAPQFPPGIQMNVPHQQQIIRARTQPGIPMHQQKSNRSPKKRSPFEAGAGGSSQFKQPRFDAAVKRKKRMQDMSNLHEVQTVDMLPPDMNSQFQQAEEEDEEEDEETQEYRKKIEQQKLEREKFLQRKEERRKLAAMEKQRELQKKDADVLPGGDAPQILSDPPQGNAIATIVNRNPVEPQPVQQQAHQKFQQVQSLKNRVGVQQQQFCHDAPGPRSPAVLTSVGGVWQVRGKRGRGAVRGGGVGRGHHGAMNQPQQLTVLAPQQEVKMVPTTKAAVMGQRIVRAPQPGTAVSQSPVVPPRRLVLTQSTGHQVTPVPRQVIQQAPKARTVVLRGTNSVTRPVEQQQGIPTRQAGGGGRSVVATKAIPPQQPEVSAQQPAVPKTKTISIENLAASTTEQQLKSLCQGIGVLENIQMLPKQRRAILRFTNPTSAATFYKRYQRKIIDLSLITVSLMPQ